jgi:hypothetical protein
LNGANATEALLAFKCLDKKENDKKNATRDVKPGNARIAATFLQ